MGNEKSCDALGFLCRHQKIQIVYDFLSPPVASSQIDLQSVAVRRKIRPQCFRFRRDLPKLERTGVRCAFCNDVTKLLLRCFAKTWQFSNTPGFAGLSQLLDGTDLKFVVKSLDLLGTKSGQ